MNKTLYLTGVVALVVSLVVGYFMPRKVVEERVGATPGTTISGSSISIGGVELYYASQPVIASSTICALKNPASATSTLTDWSVRIASSTVPVAGTMQIATSSMAAVGTSSSPVLAGFKVAASKQLYARATTTIQSTLTGLDDEAVSALQIGPNEWVVFSYIGVNSGTTYVGGTALFPSAYTNSVGQCTAEFKKL